MDRNFEIAPINASDYVAIPRGRYYAHEFSGNVINDWVEKVELVSVEVKGKRPTQHEIMERNKEQFEQIIRKDIMDNIHRDLDAPRKEFMPPVGNPPSSEAQSTSQPTPPAKPADNPPAATKPSAPQNNGNTADTPPAAKQQNTADKADGKTDGAASPSNFANVQKPDHNRSAASKPDTQPEKQTAVTHTNESSENQSEKTPTHPQDQAQNIFGNSVAAAEAGLKNPHKKFLEEADKLKQQLDFKHDLASNLSHQIMQVEEGHIYDERRAYYAQHREAVNEAVEKLRTNAAELTEQHGEVKGKLYMMGGLMKMLGGVGHVTDAVELGSLSKTAYETGDWSPVSEKVAKMVLSSAAVASSAALARGAGLLLMMAGAPAGIVAAITIGGAIALTYFTVKYINENSLEDIRQDLRLGDVHSNNGHREYEYSDLVLFGDAKQYGRPENIKLAAKNVTLIGDHHAENIEVESDTLMVAGTVNADNNLRLDSNQIQISDEINFHPSRNRQGATETPAETQEQKVETQENTTPVQADNQNAPVLENLADIGTTSISPVSDHTETVAAIHKEAHARAGRIAADLLSEDELFLPALSEPGSTATEPAAVTEQHTYADTYQTLPSLSEHQETPLI
ncbi:MAG: hypothetical protein Q4D78_09060 [Neisseria zoodegmatis]|uniref:hypothetical protein n=1 Tax=Neisseria zoodegmatis TaxID=326523 RepID=UPI0026F054F7|nr:hypothetical protein [Neisseria zoodegmatis]MDO5070320.1 hypothetical protein [Neisseria zoodegmatis]